MSVLLAALALLCPSAQAVELNYAWKPGDVHPFRYREDTTVTVSAMGMRVPPVTTSFQTDFSERVVSAAPGGGARLEITVESLSIYEGERLVATLTDFPERGRRLVADVDRKGHMSFPYITTIIKVEGQYLVGVRATAQASASVSVNGERVEIFAAVSASSGQVIATTKTVEIKEAQPLDILPRELFDMMVLPDGDLPPNDPLTVAVDMAGMKLEQRFLVTSLDANVATLQLGVKTSTDMREAASGDASGSMALSGMGMPSMGASVSGMGMGDMDDDMDDMDDMDEDMEGLGGMGGLGGLGGLGAASGMGDMKLTLDATARFDAAQGRFLNTKGSLDQSISMGGTGSTDLHSVFSLERR